MYIFKQAVKDAKEFILTDMAQSILRSVNAPVCKPSYKEIINTVDTVYKMFYKSLLFNGKLYSSLYKERKKLTDKLFLPDWLGRQIIKHLVLFAFCEDYRSPKLKDLRVLILELINLYEEYISCDKVTEDEYKSILDLKL